MDTNIQQDNTSDLREKTCFFTGHRDLPVGEYEAVKERLETEILRLMQEEGVQYFGAGGALGFDTLASLTVIALKEKYPTIKLVLILPCKDHHFGWHGKDKAIFDRICAQADKVIYTADKYYAGCAYKRNRHMAECAAWGLCYLTRPTGGTAYTVNFARSLGVKLKNLA